MMRLWPPRHRLQCPRSGGVPSSHSSRRAPGGLGLGLAIVGAIAAAHGAELRAVTRVTGGLAIEIVFPLSLPPPPLAGPNAAPARDEPIAVPG